MSNDFIIVFGTRGGSKFLLLVTKDPLMVKSVSEKFEKENPGCYSSAVKGEFDLIGEFAI